MNKSFKERSVYDKYIYEIKDQKPMNITEEREIFKKIKNGDKKAYDEILKRHLKFVVSIAREYNNDFLTVDDLISEGNYGLLKAMEKYDVETGYRFMTYAVFWIRQAILHSLNKNSRTIRLPENIIGELKNNTYEKEVAACVPLINFSDDDNEYNVSDYFVDKVDDDSGEINIGLKEIVSNLKKREKTVIEMYFGLGPEDALNLEEIGLRLNISKERVRQVKNKTLRKIKHKSLELISLKNN